MELNKVKYSDLNGKQKEIYNFQKISASLADYGFNCIKLADDWQGADFLAYHKDGDRTLKVQLKSRITIDKKYVDKDLYLAFPVNSHWYLIAHNQLLELVASYTNWLETPSWINGEMYCAEKPNLSLLNALEFAKL